MGITQVHVQATDPISQAGVIAQLASRPDVRLSEEGCSGAVCVVVVDELDEAGLRLARSAARGGALATVVVAGRLDDAMLMQAVEAGVMGIVRRVDATTGRLAAVITSAARGDAAVPPDLLGRLLTQVGTLQRQVLAPRGLTLAGLTQREIDVLRLVADGCDTAEIASKLSYSERTVKKILHDITSRMHLRNRSQAVAFALREGLI